MKAGLKTMGVRTLGFGLCLAVVCTTGCSGGWRRAAEAPGGAATGPHLSDAAIARQAEAYARFAAGVVHDTRDESELALGEYRRALEADPTNEALAIELARRFLQQRQPEEAAAALEVTLAREDAGGLVYAWLGLAREMQQDHEGAVGAFKEAVRRSPGAFPGYRGLAQLAYQAKDAEAALKVLDQAARQPDAGAAFRVDLAEMLALGLRQEVLTEDQVRGRIKDALDAAAAAQPDSPELLRRMAELYRASGFAEEAVRSYERVLAEAPPQNPILRGLLYEQLYHLYVQTGQSGKAGAQLKALLDLNPTNPRGYLLLAQFSIQQRDYPQAAEYLRRMLLLNPEFEPAYYELAGLEISVGRPEDALATLRNARERFKQNFSLEFYSALACASAEDYPTALRHFGSAEILGKVDSPERLDGFFYFQYGSACERAGNYEQAAAQFRQSLELDPENPVTLNYLGYMWADRGENLGEALKLIQQAVDKEPDNGAYLDSLAWVLFKLGRMEDALPYQLRAVALEPEPDSTLYDHLGDIYAALGRSQEAREAYDKALAVGEDEAIRRKREGLPE